MPVQKLGPSNVTANSS